jgi:SAM-dependent methyltransferase
VASLYDRVRYPGNVYAQTHPASLGAIAILLGRKVTPFDASRVLEIGCGEGLNLVNMALSAPQAEFVGVDLAETAIAAARATAAECGVVNCAFHTMDLASVGGALGDFDTIIAHGVYAWVPDAVRTALMHTIAERLRPDGLALVSYNAYPGARFRHALRDMLVYLTDGVEDPNAKLELARGFLVEEAEAWSEEDAEERALKSGAARILRNAPEVLYHDELGADWGPELVSQVVARAEPFGLEYLCDAEPKASAEAFFPTEAFAALHARADGDWVRFEQFSDFRTLRPFRNSVFARPGATDRRRVAARLRGLWACSDLKIEEGDPDAPKGALFVTNKGVELRTNSARLVDFLARLAEAFPLAVPLSEASDLDALAEHLFRLFVTEVIELRAAPYALSPVPGERPAASQLARLQAARGETSLPTLRHTMVRFEDARELAAVPLMDGTRTRAELAEEFSRRSNLPIGEARRRIDGGLPGLARLGLLAD